MTVRRKQFASVLLVKLFITQCSSCLQSFSKLCSCFSSGSLLSWPQRTRHDSLETFFLRPNQFQNTAVDNHNLFLESVHDLEPKLGVSVLFDDAVRKEQLQVLTEEEISKKVDVLIQTLTLINEEGPY